MYGYKLSIKDIIDTDDDDVVRKCILDTFTDEVNFFSLRFFQLTIYPLNTLKQVLLPLNTLFIDYVVSNLSQDQKNKNATLK